jgi:hypothetical protein
MKPALSDGTDPTSIKASSSLRKSFFVVSSHATFSACHPTKTEGIKPGAAKAKGLVDEGLNVPAVASDESRNEGHSSELQNAGSHTSRLPTLYERVTTPRS